MLKRFDSDTSVFLASFLLTFHDQRGAFGAFGALLCTWPTLSKFSISVCCDRVLKPTEKAKGWVSGSLIGGLNPFEKY